jgi:hypothetical protein
MQCIQMVKGQKNAEVEKSTTLRLNESTKNRLQNLDFVRKQSFDEIILELIKFYEGKK